MFYLVLCKLLWQISSIKALSNKQIVVGLSIAANRHFIYLFSHGWDKGIYQEHGILDSSTCIQQEIQCWNFQNTLYEGFLVVVLYKGKRIFCVT
jgi:hypothetical protein